MRIGSLVKGLGKLGKTFGQVSSGAKKFGQIIDAGRKFGSVVNNLSDGKIADSKFGRDINKLTDKAELLTGKIASGADKGQRVVENIKL